MICDHNCILQNQIDTLKAQYRSRLVSSDSELKSTLENLKCVSEIKNEEFKCIICQCLCFKPKKCNTCRALFCSHCIVQWIQAKGEGGGAACPQCREWIQFHFLDDRYQQRILIQQVYGCPHEQCPERIQQMSYEKVINHLQTECQYQYFTCPEGNCGQIVFNSNWKIHFFECQEIQLTCGNCEMKCKGLEGFMQHSCLLELIRKLDLQKQETQNYKAKVLNQIDKINEQQNEIRTLKILKSGYEEQVNSLRDKLELEYERNDDLERALNKFRNRKQSEIDINRRNNNENDSVLLQPPPPRGLSQSRKLSPMVMSPKNEMIQQNIKKPLFLANQKLFCTKHGIQLIMIHAQTYPNKTCTCCKKTLPQKAKIKKVDEVEMTAEKCKNCDIIICRYCMKTNKVKKLIQDAPLNK